MPQSGGLAWRLVLEMIISLDRVGEVARIVVSSGKGNLPRVSFDR
jgi:hypothetical protein